jgi:hypothetical protein
MIKEASFRKFVFHPNRDDVQQEFNRLSNYITRESNCVYHEVKKRKGISTNEAVIVTSTVVGHQGSWQMCLTIALSCRCGSC